MPAARVSPFAAAATECERACCKCEGACWREDERLFPCLRPNLMVGVITQFSKSKRHQESNETVDETAPTTHSFILTFRWVEGSSFQFLSPNVFTAVKRSKLKVCVADAMNSNSWLTHFQGAITMQMAVEIANMCDMLDRVELSSQPDSFAWRFSADQCYSASSAYAALFFGSVQLHGARQIWKTQAPPRIRFFF